MKWTLLLAFSFAIATGCSKSNATPDEIKDNETSITSAGVQKNNLVGKWKLVEYWQDRGDGTGVWSAAAETEEVTFTESGEVIVSGNSLLAGRGYDRYRIIDANTVELYSSSNGDLRETFYYNRESNTSLLFNPKCRENCSRRYVKVG